MDLTNMMQGTTFTARIPDGSGHTALFKIINLADGLVQMSGGTTYAASEIQEWSVESVKHPRAREQLLNLLLSFPSENDEEGQARVDLLDLAMEEQWDSALDACAMGH